MSQGGAEVIRCMFSWLIPSVRLEYGSKQCYLWQLNDDETPSTNGMSFHHIIIILKLTLYKHRTQTEKWGTKLKNMIF
jgi:hypothetical protein